MPLFRYRPAAPLDAYVECFWWSKRDELQPFCEHMLPTGKGQLIFALHAAPLLCVPKSSSETMSWSRGVVHGPQWNYFISGPKPPGPVAGVSFRTGGMGAVLGVPTMEITDRHITIDALWGNRGRDLHEQLLAARNPMAVFRILERELTARLGQPLLIHPAVAHALAPRSPPWPPIRVADVQRESGYSPKHFIALFRSAVGLTPKHFYRVQRFAGVLQSLASAGETDLAGLAASAGYSDQSHLTREFLAFAGITPTQYRPSGAGRVFHHQVPVVKNLQDGRRRCVTD